MSGHDLIYRRLWREAGDGKKKKSEVFHHHGSEDGR